MKNGYDWLPLVKDSINKNTSKDIINHYLYLINVFNLAASSVKKGERNCLF